MAARCPVTQLACVSHHDAGTIDMPCEELLGDILAMQQPEIYLVGLLVLVEEEDKIHFTSSDICKTKLEVGAMSTS